jgi:NADPH-dependent 2,4-dienoyl-CoA reductase/sulfur reductase-like enzyme
MEKVIMERCKYLVIGCGRAAGAAVRDIREVDRVGSILVVPDGDDPSYDRPPSSKALWNGGVVETIWRDTDSVGAEPYLGARIVAIDRSGKTAIHANGTAIAYERLLLATGGTPRHVRRSAASTAYYRKLSDFKRAWEAASHVAEFAVIGGGFFIGSEIAAAFAMKGCKVISFFVHELPGDRIGVIRPKTRIPAINKDVPIGLRMKVSDSTISTRCVRKVTGPFSSP